MQVFVTCDVLLEVCSLLREGEFQKSLGRAQLRAHDNCLGRFFVFASGK